MVTFIYSFFQFLIKKLIIFYNITHLYYFDTIAITSISTHIPFSKFPMATAVRTGGFSGKYFLYTLLNSLNLRWSSRNTEDFITSVREIPFSFNMISIFFHYCISLCFDISGKQYFSTY